MLTTPYGFPKRQLSRMEVDEDGNEYLAGGELINGKYGTYVGVEGALNQVLINQYENNKYLDKKEFINGLPTEEDLKEQDKITSPIIPFPELNRRLRESVETVVKFDKPVGLLPYIQYWPLFYTPPLCDGDTSYWASIYSDIEDPKFWIDEPGLNHWINRSHTQERDPLLKRPFCYYPFIDEVVWRAAKKLQKDHYEVKYRQFEVDSGSSYLLNSFIKEIESTNWFCHWPEELLYDNSAYEMIFFMTNQYRSEVGLPPMHREIRGFANTARMVTAENQRAEVIYHDNTDKFRQGYKTLKHRAENAATNIIAIGENLTVGRSAGVSIDSGKEVAEAWRNSPEHYANMVDARWESSHTAHENFGGVVARATENPSASFDPPIFGGFWSQTFTYRKYWVLAGPVNQLTEAGRVSFFSRESPVGNIYWNYNPDVICYHGRVINVMPITFKDAIYKTALLGAALFYKDYEVWVRIIYTWIADNGDYEVRCIIKPIRANHCSSIDDWFEEGSYTFISEHRYGIMSMVTFDHRGENAIFSVDRKGGEAETTFEQNHLPDEEDVVLYHKYVEVFEYSPYFGFSMVKAINPPEISYEIGFDSYDAGFGFIKEFVSRYVQEGSGVFNFLPYYHIELDSSGNAISSSIKELEYHMSLSVDQKCYAPGIPSIDRITFHNEDYIILPSGDKFYSCKQHYDAGIIIGDECYFNVILYYDPQKNDMVYARVDLFGNENESDIDGIMTIFVNEVEVKKFDSRTVTKFGLKYKVPFEGELVNMVPTLSVNQYGLSDWPIGFRPTLYTLPMVVDISGLRTLKTTYYGLTTFDAMHHYAWLRSDGQFGIQVPTKCANELSIAYHVGWCIKDVFSSSLHRRSASINECDSFYDETTPYGLMAYNCSPLLINPFLWPDNEYVFCQVAHYKDKLVASIYFDRLWTFYLEGDDRYINYANFPLEEMVGVGPLKDILPMGVV